jgi:hypothetical protein
MGLTLGVNDDPIFLPFRSLNDPQAGLPVMFELD